MERRQRGIKIEDCLNRLSDRHKAFIILRDIEGFTYPETARITGEPEQTVKEEIASARISLKTGLEGLL